MDDRGPNDLERIIDDKDKVIADLKRDNKSLAREVDNLLEQKKQLLDNQSKKWYNITMKNIMIAFLVLCFTTSVGNTNESKTYTPKETLEAFSKVPGKIANHISNEKQEIIDYQKKSWAEAKEKTAKNFAKIKSWFVKN